MKSGIGQFPVDRHCNGTTTKIEPNADQHLPVSLVTLGHPKSRDEPTERYRRIYPCISGSVVHNCKDDTET